ncbi:MAG TPA: hypothetical protein VIL97_00115, partial [Thermoanaerobaculia bacterium]
MRRFLVTIPLFVVACTTAVAPPAVDSAAPPHGLTLEEEAAILRLEDRRELDRDTAARWVAHPNPLHRVRIALALGRIG